jgi:hypothetical protein
MLQEINYPKRGCRNSRLVLFLCGRPKGSCQGPVQVPGSRKLYGRASEQHLQLAVEVLKSLPPSL